MEIYTFHGLWFNLGINWIVMSVVSIIKSVVDILKDTLPSAIRLKARMLFLPAIPACHKSKDNLCSFFCMGNEFLCSGRSGIKLEYHFHINSICHDCSGESLDVSKWLWHRFRERSVSNWRMQKEFQSIACSSIQFIVLLSLTNIPTKDEYHKQPSPTAIALHRFKYTEGHLCLNVVLVQPTCDMTLMYKQRCRHK
jgi:hypothetical protein